MVVCQCLYDLDRGTDKLILIQSVLLLSFWYTDPQDHTGAWYWVGIAISLAQSIGIHRDPQFTHNVMPIESRPLVCRIWWSCVIRDRWLSLAKGRPMRIHDEDCDVPMPRAEDIFHELYAIDSKIRDVFVPSQLDLLAETWIGLMKTSFYLGQILRLYYRVRGPKPSPQEIEKLASDLHSVGQMEVPQASTDDLVLIHKYHLDLFYQ